MPNKKYELQFTLGEWRQLLRSLARAWTRAHTNLRPRFGLFIDLTLFSVDGFWATKLIMLRPLRHILNLFTALNKQTNKHLEAGAGRSFRLTT